MTIFQTLLVLVLCLFGLMVIAVYIETSGKMPGNQTYNHDKKLSMYIPQNHQKEKIHFLNPYPDYILSWKLSLLFTSDAYIQAHFKLDYIMDANTIGPDQTAPKGAVWSGSLLFAI